MPAYQVKLGNDVYTVVLNGDGIPTQIGVLEQPDLGDYDDWLTLQVTVLAREQMRAQGKLLWRADRETGAQYTVKPNGEPDNQFVITVDGTESTLYRAATEAYIVKGTIQECKTKAEGLHHG